MGKKMKLLPLPLHLLFKTPNHSKSSWLWRSCSQPRTLSFRSSSYNNIFRTINSAYLDNNDIAAVDDGASDDPIEEVVRGLRRPGGRLFLQLEETSSIMEMASKEEEEEEVIPFFKESLVLAMDSKDPYFDFKKSMEEMVEAYGLKEWKGMEELLNWYLKANGERNHDFIIGAFVDLLVGLAFRNSIIKYSSSSSSNSNSNCCCCSSSSSSNSSSSFSKTTCLSSSLEIEEIDYCNSSSSITPPYPSLSSLFEDDEEVSDDFNSKQ